MFLPYPHHPFPCLDGQRPPQRIQHREFFVRIFSKGLDERS